MSKRPLSKSKQKILKDYTEWLAILGYSESKLYEYPRLLKVFFHWMDENNLRSLKQLDKQALSSYLLLAEQKFVTGNKTKNTTVNAVLSGIRNFGVFTARTLNIVLPTDHLKNKPVDTIPKIILTKAEIQQLYKATNDSKWGMRDRAILGLCYGAGLRRKEAISLNVKDLDLARGFVHVKQTKNYRERYVPLPSKVTKDLKDYIQEARSLFQKQQKYQRALFLSETGKILGDQTLENRLEYLLKKAAISKKATLHSLRHSIATHLMESGLSLEDISRFLGHSSLESTQIYTHIQTDEPTA